MKSAIPVVNVVIGLNASLGNIATQTTIDDKWNCSNKFTAENNTGACMLTANYETLEQTVDITLVKSSSNDEEDKGTARFTVKFRLKTQLKEDTAEKKR